MPVFTSSKHTIKAVLTASCLSTSLFFASPLAADGHSFTAEQIEAARTAREAALKDDTAYELLESLTTEIGPRLAGTLREHAAADWAVQKMKDLGFDNIRTEKFPLTVWTRTHESLHVLGASTQPLHITALGGSVSTPKGGIQAPVIHFDTYADLAAADADQVKGKIVFISNRMARAIDGAGYGPAVIARRSGASTAGKLGAKAVLIRSIGTDDHRLPHTGGLAYDEDAPKIPAVALSNPDADQLVRLLARGSVTLEMDIQTSSREGHSYNVIGDIYGSSKPDEYIVFGSHLDSWDLGTGAIDDGAGVALNLAAARIFARMDKSIRPARSIRVILFGAEEPGLIGAKAYVAAHKDDMDQHVLGAESDFGAGSVWALASHVDHSALPAIDKMAQLMSPLDIVRYEGRAFGGPDVGQLGLAGMPVLDLKQDGTDYFDLHHTADDTIDKVSREALRQNLAAWTVFGSLAGNWPKKF